MRTTRFRHYVTSMNSMKAMTTLLSGFLVALVLAFLVVGAGRDTWIQEFLDVGTRNAALRFIGAAMGGVLVALNAVAIHRRAQAMQIAAEAQAAGAREQAITNEQAEHGRRQERFKNAIEHLGHESAAVRLGGRYELYNLAIEITELRQTVLDVFCTHIRQTTCAASYKEVHATKPSFEIQDLLTLAFVREPDVFEGLGVDLENSWLQGADLRNARLWNANLRHAKLCHARLCGAHLERTDLSMADLRCAQFRGASLREANLFQARMSKCHLDKAKLQGASLWGAQLTAAWLGSANLHGANLNGAKMYGAHLGHARMQATYVGNLELQGAELEGSTWRGAERSLDQSSPFAQRITSCADSPADLGGVAFSGGMNKRQVTELIDELICDAHESLRNELRYKLEGHIGSPVHWGVPPPTKLDSESYAPSVAEEWIAEHEEAMAKVP